MTDLETTRLCAEAMGYSVTVHSNRKSSPDLMWVANNQNWNPLKDDAQAMALVKKFDMWIDKVRMGDASLWTVSAGCEFDVRNSNLNRAICECVAKMQTICVPPPKSQCKN